MTPVDPVAPAEGGTLPLDFDLPHAPEKVWRGAGRAETQSMRGRSVARE